jgi:hypothetical protein
MPTTAQGGRSSVPVQLFPERTRLDVCHHQPTARFQVRPGRSNGAVNVMTNG